MKTLLLIAVALLPAFAQPRDLYKVDFTIRDTSEPSKNPRKYSLLIFGQDKAVLRVNTRLPITIGSNSVNSYEAGISLDCTIQEVAGKLSLHADVGLTSVFPPDKTVVSVPTTSSVNLNITSAV